MAALEVTKKLQIYHTLYRLNLSFSAIVTHCEALRAAGIFKGKSAHRFQGFAQELQAEMNEAALDVVHSTELEDWARFGKARKAWEKHLRDPDDVLLAAEERKGGLRRKRKK